MRLLVLACLLLLQPLVVQSHELSMAEMQLLEVAPGQFVWQWGITDKRPPAEILRARWPEGCEADSTNIRCGKQGLKGELSIDGIGVGYSSALIRIKWLDGQERIYTLTGGQPSVHLYGSADDKRGFAEIASTYTVLGITHILNGVDHLLFVVGLLFLVGFTRKLVWTITAFTVAHSLTLASAALGLLTLAPAPVEANIALSIVLVVAEAVSPRDSLAKRVPAVVAFGFGLVHGLGFAGALKDIGFPQNYLPSALLTFNIGVELGNLMFVAAVWMLWRSLRRWPRIERARTPFLYAIGTIAAYWSWLRIATILG